MEEFGELGVDCVVFCEEGVVLFDVEFEVVGQCWVFYYDSFIKQCVVFCIVDLEDVG